MGEYICRDDVEENTSVKFFEEIQKELENEMNNIIEFGFTDDLAKFAKTTKITGKNELCKRLRSMIDVNSESLKIQYVLRTGKGK